MPLPAPIVGIIANPASGRDLRRLTANAGLYSSTDKASAIQRLLAAFGATGIGQVLLPSDMTGIAAAVLKASQGPGARDQHWPAIEILDLPLHADLVTLSACDTALGSGTVILGGAVALLPVFARDVLVLSPDQQAWAFGVLRASPAIGAALVAAALVSTSALAADVAFDFDVAKPEGRIMVALFDSEANYGGEGQPAQVAMLDAAAGQTSVTFDGLPDGDYAVRAFHDLNGDGKMNTNPFGMPVEPFAFSNNAVGNMGPAKWDRARFEVSGATAQTIRIR